MHHRKTLKIYKKKIDISIHSTIFRVKQVSSYRSFFYTFQVKSTKD